MRKIICIIAVLVFCLSSMVAVLAAEGEFVPSISYKDSPDIDEGELQPDPEVPEDKKETVVDCLVITSIMEAEEKTTDITQEAQDELLWVYDQLSEGDMKLPLEQDYVIRDLVDVDFSQHICIEGDHDHEEKLEKPGIRIKVKFDLGIAKDEKITVLSYHQDKWDPVVSTVNNGDGTVTCELEHFCPVVFVMDKDSGPSVTGDPVGQNMIFWVAVMLAAMSGAVALLACRKKFMR